MNTLLYFIKSNLKYNKVELAISYGITIIFTLLYWYFTDGPEINEKSNGGAELFISIAIYAVLYVFFSQKRKTSIKYFLSLPLSKSEILLYKSFSDIVFFIPAIYFVMMGTYYLKLDIHFILLFISLLILSVVAGLWMFDQEIEQPRLDNAKSSFVNRLVYLRKSTEFIFRSILITYLLIIVIILPIDFIFKEYIFLIFLGVTLFMKFQKSLLLMKDESLSYFKVKRDVLRISWKLALLLGPVIVVQLKAIGIINPYGDQEIFNDIYYNDMKAVHEYFHEKKQWQLEGKDGYTPLLSAIHLGRLEIVKFMLATGAKLFEENSKEKHNPLVLAIDSGSAQMLEVLIKEDKNYYEKNKDSLFIYASKSCRPDIIDELIKHKPNLNYQDKNGRTVLHHQVLNKCYSGIIILVNAGVDVEIKDKKNKKAIEYGLNNNISYFLNSKSRQKVVLKKEDKRPYLLQRDIATKLLRQ